MRTAESKTHDHSRGEEQLASSADRLERATTALEEAAGNNEDQEALERNPSKCNSVTLILNSN